MTKSTSETPEYKYSEKSIIDQLTSMGWEYIEGDTEVAENTERENFKQVLLIKRLQNAIKTINLDENGKPWLEDNQIDNAIAQLERLGTSKLIEANQTVTDLLLSGTPVQGKDGKNTNIQYIDFNNPDNNDFLVINQFRVDPPWSSGDRGFIIPDIVLLVNGIPLVVIECKSPKL